MLFLFDASSGACIGRVNRSFRCELLDAWVFRTVATVREQSDGWRVRYNTERAHDAPCRVPPCTFLPGAPSSVPGSHFKRRA